MMKRRHDLRSLLPRRRAQKHTGRTDVGLLSEGLCPLLNKREDTNTEKWFVTICIHSTLQEFGEEKHACFLLSEIIGLIQSLTA